MSPVGPFDVVPVADRLKATTTTFRRVVAAADLDAAAKDAGQPSPGAYVLLANEVPGPRTGGSTRLIQPVVTTFAVVIRIANVRQSELGMQHNVVLKECIADVRNALLGWRPDSSMTACELGGGDIQNYENGVIWWIETFRLTYFVTKDP